MFKGLVICFIFSATGVALAEPVPDPQAELEYRFDDELVMGTTDDPLLDWMVVRKGSGRSSLIEVKRSLVVELLKSVEDL